MSQKEVVWTAFIRIFHWSLVALFIAAYVTSTSGDDELHLIFGYAVTILIVMRIVYGFWSLGYARFSRFLYTPAKIWQHSKQMMQNRPDHYIGHSPVGSLMVFALLLLLLVLTTAGLISEGWSEYEGPLWMLGIMPSDAVGHWAKHIHEFLPDVLIVLIILHVLGVLLACVQHKENLVRAMLTGRKSIVHKGVNE